MRDIPMKFILIFLMVLLCGCGPLTGAKRAAANSPTGVAKLCFEGVTYLVTASGSMSAQFNQDSAVINCK